MADIEDTEDDSKSVIEQLQPVPVDTAQHTPHDRLTITSNIYYQQVGEEAAGVTQAFAHICESQGEDCYRRRQTATEFYKHVDVGFLHGNVGCIVLHNRAYPNNLIPDQEELNEDKEILISFDGVRDDIRLPVGCGIPLFLPPDRRPYIKVAEGSKRIDVLVIPK